MTATVGVAVLLACSGLVPPAASAAPGHVFAAPIAAAPVTVSCAVGGKRVTVAAQVAFADVRHSLDRRLGHRRGHAVLDLTVRGAGKRVLARARGAVRIGSGYHGNHGYLGRRFRLGPGRSARVLRYALGAGGCPARPHRNRTLRIAIGVEQSLPVPVALGAPDHRAVARARLGAKAGLVAVRSGAAGYCAPYPCYRTAAEVLAWKPSDVDPLDRASAPLAPRPTPAGPRMLAGFDNGAWAYWSGSDLNSQGSSLTGNVFNFPVWQYLDLLYYYSHNLLSVPPTVWVNAAHRNGVPVLASVTGDCGECGPQLDELFKQHGPAMVKTMYELAAAYGFDGWMIDVENGVGYSKPMLEAMEKLKAMTLPSGRRPIVLTYQAGGTTLQNNPELAEAFFAAGNWQADYESGPPSSSPRETYEYLLSKKLTERRVDAYWASYVYAFQAPGQCNEKTGPTYIWNGKECLDAAELLGNLGSMRQGSSGFYQSAAFYAPGWPMFGGRSETSQQPAPRATVAAAESRLWAGTGGYRLEGSACMLRQPSQSSVSSLIAPRPTLTTAPFVTRFDTGEGDAFFVGGRRVGGQWNLLSAQDAVPSEQCNDSASLEAKPYYGAALDGGSSLLVEGEVFPSPSANRLYLFEASALLPAKPGFTLAYHTSLGPEPRVVVWIGGKGPISLETKTVPSGDGWTHTLATLPAGVSPGLLTRVGLAFPGGPSTQRVSTLVGELGVVDLTASPPALIQPTFQSGRLVWTDPGAARTRYYNVWALRSGESCARFVGRTLLPGYDLGRALFAPTGTQTAFRVQPVTVDGLEAPLSPPAC